MEWQEVRWEAGLCRGLPPDLFHPAKEDHVTADLARDVCADCPIRIPCRVYAVRAREMQGIWGGLSERKRREMRRDLWKVKQWRKRAVMVPDEWCNMDDTTEIRLGDGRATLTPVTGTAADVDMLDVSTILLGLAQRRPGTPVTGYHPLAQALYALWLAGSPDYGDSVLCALLECAAVIDEATVGAGR